MPFTPKILDSCWCANKQCALVSERVSAARPGHAYCLYIHKWLIKMESSCICWGVSCYIGSYSLHWLLFRSYLLRTASAIIIISSFFNCEHSHHIFICVVANLISFSFYMQLNHHFHMIVVCSVSHLSHQEIYFRAASIHHWITVPVCHLHHDGSYLPFFSAVSGFLPVLKGTLVTFELLVPPGIRPVSHLYLSEVTSDSVLVAWNAPAPVADLFILSYSSADETDTSKATLDGFKTKSLIQGLLPSTQYTISLITIQGDVTSEPITASLTTGEQLDSWKSAAGDLLYNKCDKDWVNMYCRV